MKSAIETRSPEAEGAVSWRLVECALCGLAYLPTCPSGGALYSSSYYGKRSGISRWMFNPFNRWWSCRKARRLIRLGKGPRWLDYGCGRGDLLEALEAEGCDLWGVETQKDCAEELGRRRKGRVATSLEELSPPDGGWDGLVLYHVLEHLENPEEILVALRLLARSEAILFVAVPNWQSWERRVFGDRWFHLDPPRHVQHFSPDNLRRLLDQTGWLLRKVEFKTTAYDLFGLFQSLLNLGPGPRNYFYRRFKRGEDVGCPRRERWEAFIWMLLAALPAAVVAFVMTPGLAWMGRTGTFEIVASAKDAG